MKRSVIGFCATFALFTYLEIRFSLWSLLPNPLPVLLLAFVVIAVACEFSRTAAVGILLSGAFCGLLFAATYTDYCVQPVQRMAGRSFSVQATVCDYAKSYDDEQRVLLKIAPSELGLFAVRPKIKTLAYVPKTQPPLQPGDKISAALSFYEPSVSDGFERAEYHAANSVFILAACAENDEGETLEFAVQRAARLPLWAYPLRTAQNLRARIASALPAREAGLTTAILIGDKSGMTDADALALRKAGLSHVTAVSGMHVGFLVSFFFVLFGRKWGSFFSIFAILFFIPMAGASPSVIRAGVMYLIAAIGFCIGREKDSLNSLCLALLLLLVANPYAISSLSLQLSFAATLGLILFSGRMQAFFMRPFAKCGRPLASVLRFFIGSATCSLSAMAFTTPILFAAFGYVSVFAPIANLLCVSVVGLLFVCGHLCGFLLLLAPGSAAFCGAILKPIAGYLLLAAHKVAALPYGLVYWDNRYGAAAFIAIYVALALLLLPRPKIKLRYVLPPLCGILVVTTALGVRDNRRLLTTAYLPSGAGQTIVVSDARGACALIDCGASGFRDASANVREYMAWHNLSRIDTLILTAVDKTHARSVPDLLRTVPVGRIICPPKVRKSDISEEITATAARVGVPITVWSQTDEAVLPDSPAGSLSLIGGVERKLCVRIRAQNTDVLVLHSLTQKMLDKFLSETPLSADTVVLAEANLEDTKLLQSALERLEPQEIILQSGYNQTTQLAQQYPARNTYVEGEITQKDYILTQ